MKKLILLAVATTLVFACKPEPKEVSVAFATVRDVKITEEDVKRELMSLPASVQGFLLTEGGVEMLIEEMVKKELLYLEAKSKGIDKKKEYQDRIKELQKVAMVQLLLELEIEKKVEVTNQDVKDYYDNNKSEFIIKSNGKKKPEVIEFDDEVRDLLKQRLAAERRQKEFDSYIEDLKKSYGVSLNEEAIKEFGKKSGGEEKPDEPSTE